MATKAAKSITINATKYELANALGADNGKIQLKAKDVVLDEVTPPSTESYVRFVADGRQKDGNTIPATAITIEKSADITNMTWAQFVEKVRTGTKVSLKIITGRNKYASVDESYIVEDPTIIDGIVSFDQDCVKFQFTGINRADGYGAPLIYTGTKSFHYNYFWYVSRASVIDWDNFGDDEGRPLLHIYEEEVVVPADVVKITKCKVLAPSGYDKGFLEAMAVNDSVTCTIPSGFPKKGAVDSGLVYGGIQGADLVINDSTDTNGLYIVPLQLVHASGGTQPRYAYFTLYDGKVFRTVLSTGGGTNQWDITRIS